MSDADETRIMPGRRGRRDLQRDPDETAKPSGGATPSPPPPPSSDKTVIYRPSRKTASSGTLLAPAENSETDPVVGWLVIVDGPGRGRSVNLGYGMNSIGRAPDQRIRLEFGDEQISRKEHAMLTYDPRGRKFYLQHGGGANLTYLGDVPVLQPAEIKGGETISLGNTKLRFVPLCGSDFDWGEDNAAGS